MSKITLGSWLTLNNPSIAEIMASSGFDWLCIDMEHSVTDYKEAQLLIMAIQSKGLKAYIRVGENNPRIIKRVLDAGADGIIVPMVNSREDAIRAVEAVNYPPVGKRGVGLARAQGYGFNFDEYKNQKANNILLIAQIEHIDAVNQLDDILSLDGIHGTIIGPYDLSGSMGKPGSYDDEDVKQVLNKYESTAKKYDKLIGFHVIQPDYKLVMEKIDQGYNFIAFSLDSIFLGQAARTQTSKLREKLGTE
ncbi:MAG: 2,4-dihydroxyhept-2-ene-1,7-dioic acid aldolase [Candidatus Marinimicrobia bacterium]|nr:2,4-dihydroxyhept-2-ene-1,7-dioic acid aldolase [Candidatus Neomarinimicrobiota bacterium]